MASDEGFVATSSDSFEVNWIDNIRVLADAILEERYCPGTSTAFVIYDPMTREIFAAKFRDRVVHHLLYDMQAKWWDERFIYNSYSCRVGKGTLFGINQAQRMMRSAISEAMDKAEAAGRPRNDWRKRFALSAENTRNNYSINVL